MYSIVSQPQRQQDVRCERVSSAGGEVRTSAARRLEDLDAECESFPIETTRVTGVPQPDEDRVIAFASEDEGDGRIIALTILAAAALGSVVYALAIYALLT